ncbi:MULTISPECIES: type VI secretion system accessory protein TagJ [Shewanella]|uniref:Virulence protein SciE type n=1 Tax=Shewanella japonica TaxID=93973 RepID=A0ABM6JLS4_9GAMM|nr:MULTISPECIES: type VI secretion system accessory protein TagJ [Shewanella]ARD22742.1 virulence protein SciE type [Shewanella japonica]KPZ72647.1 ImpE protein [Shewanella sp. P1-14-1]OBT11146.1 virulence protein, SciE type [Shewanella sp. UCD-FRSSP16_17]
MKKIQQMLQSGQLQESIKYVEAQLREDPMNVDLKSAFIELLCINGELERADKQLNLLVQKHPDFLIGASNLRQLIRAEQSRQDYMQGNSVPKLFADSDDHVEALMKLRLALTDAQKGNDTANEVAQCSQGLEAQRPQVSLLLDDQVNEEIRDLDDTLGGFIEIFGTDGYYYLAQLSEIEYINFQPVSSLVETVWRRVDLAIKNGPSGEAHIPLVYGNSETDAQKLGRETDWQEVATDVMTGKGLKMWFADDNALPLNQVTKIHTPVLQ